MKLLIVVGAILMSLFPERIADHVVPHKDLKIDNLFIGENEINAFRVPIEVKDHIYLNLIIQDRYVGSFLFDTGANGLILDGAFARSHKIPTISSERLFGEKSYTYGGGEGRMETEFVRNVSMDIHTISLDHENVRVLELNELLGESLGHKIDGIIGYDVFKDYLIDIRFDLGYMRFAQRKENIDLSNYAELAYDNNYQKPLVPIQMNLKNGEHITARCIFDMGSAEGLALNSRKIFDEQLFSKTNVYNCDDNRLGGIGGITSNCYTKIASIEIGDRLIFESVEVELSRDKRGALGWHDMYDGLLGMDIIRHYHVVIDQKNKTIYLGVPRV